MMNMSDSPNNKANFYGVRFKPAAFLWNLTPGKSLALCAGINSKTDCLTKTSQHHAVCYLLSAESRNSHT